MRYFLAAVLTMVSVVAGSGHLAAQDMFTVILLHGKGGFASSQAMTPLIEDLEGAGFDVVAPEMTWSKFASFDLTYQKVLAGIGALVKEARAGGAAKIVVAGHSLGASAAIAYGAAYGGINGVAAVAPGHIPEIWGRKKLSADVAKARAMVKAGKGGEKAEFNDINQGDKLVREMTAEVYLSYFDPDGPAVMPRNAAGLKPGIPLLWIIGKRDRMHARGKGYAFDKAPSHPNNAYMVVRGGHMATPRLGADDIIGWLKRL